MNFQSETKALLHAVTAASKGVVSRSTIPVLECLLLRAEDNTLRLTGTNMDAEVTATCEAAVASADRRLAAQPDLVSPSWQVYAVVPAVIEFWQADKDRQHIRVQYRREGEAWSRTLLWP